ncbi:MAG TPA: hypothetical protein PLC15_25430 [Candidatus Obscuribacter sp.]|nr:hypothetical protein [Candidatus Obscuribacter sp.]MBL8086016.1 hypothetical protein [Candidatus Obscuribacter sp.]HNB18753.1 hypothetical protein [Candidatus Obscuribacter sp.]HND69831.1 hypothetical protein [Candidatus Obscuribacter sp.]HNG73909.1 hypothetical protein [Candidatus Obscuribacter sp.]
MSDNNDKTCEASAPALPEVPHCNICGARSVLADALASLGKAVADVHHLSRHWRTAHEKREASNYDAEARTAETIAQFDADTADEARWFALYEASLTRFEAAHKAAVAARAEYHENLKEYTDTRVVSD